MQGHKLIALFVAAAVLAGCHSEPPQRHETSSVAIAPEPVVEGTVVGDDKTAMEAAVDAGGTRALTSEVSQESAAAHMSPNAPDSYVVKRGDTLWGISKVFLRDPWYWPEIWQVNPQVHNPHLIYPGDTLRLVYIEGKPQILLQRAERGDAARVEPRVRSQPLEASITTIPYATVAAFMSKPIVLDKDQIKGAPYVLDARDYHVLVADGETFYAR
jgi:LysM repeat protein